MKRMFATAASIVVLAAFTSCRTGVGFSGATPSLTGEWETTTYSHHHAEHGYRKNTDPSGQWVITEQQGHHFHGERTYTRHEIDGATFQEGFSGVISADNTRVYLVDHQEDIAIGDIISDTEMVFYILGKTYSDQQSRAGYVILKKR